MSRVECFWVEPHATAQRSLRRFCWTSTRRCPKHPAWGCDASVIVDVEILHPLDGYMGSGLYPTDEERRDPRWPTACAACGQLFADTDEWQVNLERYAARDTGERWPFRHLPAGAMWDASSWWPEKTADGLVLQVMLPDGIEWMIDGEATNGGRWTRSGTPPRITARPSILTPGYHGLLTDGVLESC